jgi:nucleoid-associated protein YejK
VLLSSFKDDDVDVKFLKYVKGAIGKKIPDELRRYLEEGFDKKLELHEDSFSEFKNK